MFTLRLLKPIVSVLVPRVREKKSLKSAAPLISNVSTLKVFERRNLSVAKNVRPKSPSQLGRSVLPVEIVLAQVENVRSGARRARRKSGYSRIPVSTAKTLEKRIVLLGFAVDDSARDVEFLSDERLQTETSVVNAATRRFVAIEAGKTRRGWIEVDPRRNSKIDKTIVTKAAESLQKRKIDRTNLTIGANAEIVRA